VLLAEEEALLALELEPLLLLRVVELLDARVHGPALVLGAGLGLLGLGLGLVPRAGDLLEAAALGPGLLLHAPEVGDHGLRRAPHLRVLEHAVHVRQLPLELPHLGLERLVAPLQGRDLVGLVGPAADLLLEPAVLVHDLLEALLELRHPVVAVEDVALAGGGGLAEAGEALLGDGALGDAEADGLGRALAHVELARARAHRRGAGDAAARAAHGRGGGHHRRGARAPHAAHRGREAAPAHASHSYGGQPAVGSGVGGRAARHARGAASMRGSPDRAGRGPGADGTGGRGVVEGARAEMEAAASVPDGGGGGTGPRRSRLGANPPFGISK